MKTLKKRIRVFILALVLLWNAGSVCLAEILPPYGEGQIGLQAVILCESLTVRQDRSTSSKAVKTLHYGDVFVTQEYGDGWANCFISDSGEEGAIGWVSMDYIVIDPAWYRADDATPVYAWNDLAAPRVALIRKDTKLAILKDEGEWLIVSLRGATGWIHKTEADLLSEKPAGTTEPAEAE